MGNQGYSHEATRVASEIIWAGEIGDVSEVHAFRGRPQWPQGMMKTPPPTPVPATLDWDLWLGTAAQRPFTAGRSGVQDFVTARNAGRARGGAAGAGAQPREPAARRARLRPAVGPAWAAAKTSATICRSTGGLLRFRQQPDRRLGRAHSRSRQLGARTQPREPGERGVRQEGPAPAHDVSELLHDQVRVQGAQGHAARDRLLASGGRRRCVHPKGNDSGGGPQDSEHGPQVGPANTGRAGAGAGAAGRGGAGAAGRAGAGAPGGGAQQSTGYNCIFVAARATSEPAGAAKAWACFPGSRWADYTLPPAFLSRSRGISGTGSGPARGAPACSEFRDLGAYTEWLVLGSAAVRVEGKLLYDAKTGCSPTAPRPTGTCSSTTAKAGRSRSNRG